MNIYKCLKALGEVFGHLLCLPFDFLPGKLCAVHPEMGILSKHWRMVEAAIAV